MQCQAKAKSTGEQCRRWAVAGKRVCTVHGGLTPRGIASANFRHGRYSKSLPARLTGRYQEAASDPELLALREDIALLDSRISDVLSRVDSGESGALWKSLGTLRTQFLVAQRSKDEMTMQVALMGLLNAVAQGYDDFMAWADVVDLLERRRRLVESEQKRLVAMQQMVTAEQAMTLIAALASSMREHVLDRVEPDVARDILSAVQRDLDKFSRVGAGTEIDAGK